MTNHTFLGGMGLGLMAGAAMGMAVAAKGKRPPVEAAFSMPLHQP